MSFLMLLNSGSQEPKLIEVDLTAYKLIVKESSLVLLFKVFTKSERLRLDMLYLIYIKKMT